MAWPRPTELCTTAGKPLPANFASVVVVAAAENTETRPGAGISPRTVALAKMLEVVDKAEASPDLWSERWSKLCLNNMGNTPQAMSGMAGPEVNHTPEGRRLTILAAAETVRVGVAKGYTLGKVQGRPAEDWARAAEDEALYAELEAQLTPTTPPPAEPSRWDEKGTQDNWKVSMPQVRSNGESAKEGAELRPSLGTADA